MPVKREPRPIPGRLVTFLIGKTDYDLTATDVVEIKTMKSAPSYYAVIPKQKVIRIEQRHVLEMEVGFLVKAYLPHIVVVEASIELADILASDTLDIKRALIAECRRVLLEFGCNSKFDEEYSVYCISDYSGDPEVYLSVAGDRVAGFLKNEDQPLDESEVSATLSSSLKYGKNDVTIVDWDGAFIFDSTGDFRSDIELFEIANLQLLRYRILDNELDRRLEHTLRLLKSSGDIPFFKSREVRRVLRDIIEIRTQSILESEAVEHNIKLIGDWYSARLYSLIARKFHLDTWSTDIKEKLDTLEDVYTMAAENFSLSYRATIEFVILAGWFILLLLYIGEFLMLKFLAQ